MFDDDEIAEETQEVEDIVATKADSSSKEVDMLTMLLITSPQLKLYEVALKRNGLEAQRHYNILL